MVGDESPLAQVGLDNLLAMANAAQLDLTLLTFEFLFCIGLPPLPKAAAFQNSHQNEWLRQFRTDFANGIGKDRLNDTIARTDGGF